ncbi:accessory Sec system translocase SecA2, partial [Butyricicoccus sp. 1XD8-22]
DIVLGEGVAELGGLYVIGTEKHESRRVDNQLRGRSGRQGDPGESRFILSIEDDMFRRFAKEDTEKFMKKMVVDPETKLITNKEVTELIDRTQRIVEGAHFSLREYNLKLDDVINEQRRIIYSLRDNILKADNLMEHLQKMLFETIDFAVRDNAPEEADPIEWDFDNIEQTLNTLYLTPIQLNRDVLKINNIFDEVEPGYLELKQYIESFKENERVMKIIPMVMLRFIDVMWVKHLEQMAHLKEGIGLRRYQQEDPMRIYQREGLELFGKNYQELRRSIVEELVAF